MRKPKKRKLILWDTSFIELYGPRELMKDRKANSCAKDLMATFAGVVKECLRDSRKVSRVLKKFRVKIE